MASKTTTYVVRIDNAEGFDARATDSKTYTHAVVGTYSNGEAAASWHSSRELATKALQALQSQGQTGLRIVEAFGRNGSKVTVTKALRAELAAAEAAHMEANVPGVKELGERLAAEAPAKAEKPAKKAEPKKAEKKAPRAKVDLTAAPVPVKGKVKKAADPTEMTGYRVHTRSRTTKTVAVLVDGQEAGFNTSAGKWQTICLEHSFIAAHPGQRPARDRLAHPELWCEPCAEAFKAEA